MRHISLCLSLPQLICYSMLKGYMSLQPAPVIVAPHYKSWTKGASRLLPTSQEAPTTEVFTLRFSMLSLHLFKVEPQK